MLNRNEKYERDMQQQRGFIALLGVIIIAITLCLSVFLIRFGRNALTDSEKIFTGLAAQNLAEAGIQEIFAKLNKDAEFVERTNSNASNGLILQTNDARGGGTCRVYKSVANGNVIFLSIGELNGLKRQAVAYLRFSKEESVFYIMSLDNE